ncbi:MAG: hypothetical protein Q9190_001084 [Brigantiaea leucoxantha]
MSAKRTLRSVSKKVLDQTSSQIANRKSIPHDSTIAAPIKAQKRKGAKKAKNENAHLGMPGSQALEEPLTPPRKRTKSAPNTARSESAETVVGDVCLDRPAEPHRTNAPLKTPKGSKLLTYSKEVVDCSPSKTGIPPPTTSTGQLLDQACAYLIKVDPRLRNIIEKHHCHIFSPEGLAEEIEPFESLCSSIIAQQVSGAAAKSIKNKFVGLFENEQKTENSGRSQLFPTPNQVAISDISFLRQAGLSQRKAEYIKGLAEKFSNGDLSAEMLIKATDEEVLEKLTAVRGLGKWSVEMFACFALKRMDVFSTGDLGVQRGMAVFVGKDVNKLKAKGGKWKYMSESDMIEHSEKFSPYR